MEMVEILDKGQRAVFLTTPALSCLLIRLLLAITQQTAD